MFWWLFFFCIILLIYLNFWKPLNFWEQQGVPYLKPWPVVGNMGPFLFGRSSLYHLIEHFYKSMDTRYLGVWSFSEPILVVRDIDLAKQICIKGIDHFIDHKNFLNESNEPVFSENLFSSTGQKWRDLRATLSPAFTGSKMRSMFVLMSECAERYTNHFEKACIGNTPLEREVKDIFKRYTIDVFGTCAFGVESNSLEDKNNHIYQMGQSVTNFAGLRGLKILGFLFCPNLMKAIKVTYFSKKEINFFREIVTKTIDYREKNGDVRPDLIHTMMQARKGQLKFDDPAKYSYTGYAAVEESYIGKHSEVKLEITDDLIVAQAMVFFIAGTDPTSILLAFVAYELAVNMDIQNKLQEEIDATYEECNGKITYEGLTGMKYLDMVVTETLRKWPEAFGIDRICNKDFTVEPTSPGEKRFVINKGQVIWLPVAGFHKDPKYYPNPEKFDPERFSEENKKNLHTYAYLPFGQGPRSCIGNRFALLVTKTALFHFLHKFSFVVTQKTDIPFEVNKSQVMLDAKNGFWLGIQKRST